MAEEQVPPAPKNDSKLFKVYGREFDVATEDGFKQAQTWAEAMSTLVGKQSNEIGDLRKEVEPIRKYNLKGATVDEVALRTKVEQLRDEGNHREADNLMLELVKQSRIHADTRAERETMWADYRTARKEIFDVLPEDMAKSYVFGQYASELESAEDPFALIDRVLQPKAAKLKPRPAVEPPVATATTGTTPAAKPAAPAADVDDRKIYNDMLAEMGFK